MIKNNFLGLSYTFIINNHANRLVSGIKGNVSGFIGINHNVGTRFISSGNPFTFIQSAQDTTLTHGNNFYLNTTLNAFVTEILKTFIEIFTDADRGIDAVYFIRS